MNLTTTIDALQANRDLVRTLSMYIHSSRVDDVGVDLTNPQDILIDAIAPA